MTDLQLFVITILAWGLLVIPRAAAGADNLAAHETALQQSYLSRLTQGAARDAVLEDAFADMDAAGLMATMSTYITAPADLPPASRRALEALLARQSRVALLPTPLLRLYSPLLLTRMLATDDQLSGQFFAALLTYGGSQTAWDVAVRLTPHWSLQHLAAGDEMRRAELLAAWARRLRLSPEQRELPQLATQLPHIAAQFHTTAADAAELLAFMAGWPCLADAYGRAMAAALSQWDAESVLAALQVQFQNPVQLDRNVDLVRQFTNHPSVQVAAISAFAADQQTDHAPALRSLWQDIPPDRADLRHACLFAMTQHADGNAPLAAAAALADPLEYMDVAAGILVAAPALARQVVTEVLEHGGSGIEPALRLALSLRLDGFADAALQLLSSSNELIVQLAACRYLQSTDGATRRRLAPWLTSRNDDLRLAAIMACQDFPPGPERDEFGPSLVAVALADPSPGHRQEAMFRIAQWRDPQAEPLFRQTLDEQASLITGERMTVTEANYWQYRLRLVALVGLSALGAGAASSELARIHELGNPSQRMDVLLAWRELARVPEAAFADLQSTEAKLVATAVELIASHGTAAQSERLQQYLTASPLWAWFAAAGIDDHDIRQRAGHADAPLRHP